MIRKATIKDKDTIRKLVMLASDIVFIDILKTKDQALLDELFDKYFLDDSTKFSWHNYIVYEVDNQVVGCLCFYPQEKELEYNARMEEIAGVPDIMPIEGIALTTYCDTLAVFEEYRGKGIAKQLFKYAIDSSPNDLSLLVETYKDKALSLYERIGFKVVAEVALLGTNLYQMIYKK